MMSVKNCLRRLAGATLATLLMGSLLTLGGCGASATGGADDSASQTTTASGSSQAGEQATAAAASSASAKEAQDVQVIGSGGVLTIPCAEVTTNASFYTAEVDGTVLEVIAVENSEGDVCTAFNTCQVCYGSSRAYYVQEGDYLVCQNCGNRFSMDQVGVEAGGCNPWPILEGDRTETDDEITLSYDYLSQAAVLFSNWKTTY